MSVPEPKFLLLHWLLDICKCCTYLWF